MARRGIVRLIDDYPFLVLSVDTDQEKLRRALEPLHGVRIKTRDLVQLLDGVGRVKIHGSFAPDRWGDPETFGSYSWPGKTLVERAGDVELELVPLDRWGVLTLPLFSGIGIAAIYYDSVDGRVVKRGVPMAVALRVPRKPRAVVVVKEIDGTIYAATADPELGGVLTRHGFRGMATFPPIYAMKRGAGALERLAAIDLAALWRGAWVFMLDDLDKDVRRYGGVVRARSG